MSKACQIQQTKVKDKIHSLRNNSTKCISQAYFKEMELYPCLGINKIELKIGNRLQSIHLSQGKQKENTWKDTFNHYINQLDLLERQVILLLKIYEAKFDDVFRMGFDIELMENLCNRSIPVDTDKVTDKFHIIEAIFNKQFEASYAYP